MGRKVKIEFEEVAGYAQRDSIRLWVEEKEITDGYEKARFLQNLEKIEY